MAPRSEEGPRIDRVLIHFLALLDESRLLSDGRTYSLRGRQSHACQKESNSLLLYPQMKNDPKYGPRDWEPDGWWPF